MSEEAANKGVANPPGGIKSVLQYTGIPASWLKRPKLPSRNWLIFISVVTSLTGLYADDRRRCKKIRQEYVTKVQHLAEEPLHKFDWARKVTVYGCRWPEDHDVDRSMKFFRKYVKPIFVAAALDYECINGKSYGDLATRISDDIKTRRRISAGLEQPKGPAAPLLVGDRSEEAQRQRELEGGIVIIGRPAYKEFMEGLRRGWSESVHPVDKEEGLAKALQNDGIFDEPSDEGFDSNTSTLEAETVSPPHTALPVPPTPKITSPLSSYGAFSAIKKQPAKPAQTHSHPFIDEPPAVLPFHPSIALVPFTNHLGFFQVPYMIYDFFTERYRVQAGCEAAYKVVMGHTREMNRADTEFDLQSEAHIKEAFQKVPKRQAKAKEEYYAEVAKKLKAARELARREREPTKAEIQNPPPTEVELRDERMKKEKKWRADLEGWEILTKPVVWDERFSVLRTFDDPPKTLLN